MTWKKHPAKVGCFFLDKIGIPYKKIEDEGLMIPVLEVNCKYKHPARYADTIQEVEKYLAGYDDWVLLKDVYDRNHDWQWRWNENWLEPIVDLEVDTDKFMNLFNIEGE